MKADELEEYKTFARRSSSDITRSINIGTLYHNTMKPVNTPMSNEFDVRFMKTGDLYEYYFFEKGSKTATGFFGLQLPDSAELQALTKIIKPGVKPLKPHMDLHPAIQGKGFGSKIYDTFMKGGNFVFFTNYHSRAARGTWNSVASRNGYELFIYNARTGEISHSDPAKHNSDGYLVMGPKERFKL